MMTATGYRATWSKTGNGCIKTLVYMAARHIVLSSHSMGGRNVDQVKVCIEKPRCSLQVRLVHVYI